MDCGLAAMAQRGSGEGGRVAAVAGVASGGRRWPPLPEWRAAEGGGRGARAQRRRTAAVGSDAV